MVLNQSLKVLCMAVHGNLTTISNRESNKYIGVTIRKLQCTAMHSIETCSFHPLDGTALGAPKFPATWRLETSRLGPVMLTKSEGRRGSQVGRFRGSHHWDKEFPEPLTGASLRSRRQLSIRQCK